MIKVAINGFGRIGRLVFRAGMKNKKIDFVAVNDLTDAKTLANLLKNDSVHGVFDAKVEAGKDYIKVNGKKIHVLCEKDHTKLPWKKFNVDIVVESTGRFRKESELEDHIKCGAKKVLLAAPGKGGDVKTVIMGANEKQAKRLKIMSNASCTTNSLIPVVQVLDKEFGIEAGFISTIHAYTNDQRLLNLPHKDLRRGMGSRDPRDTLPWTFHKTPGPHLRSRLFPVACR